MNDAQKPTMHIEDISPWKHEHVFDTGNPEGERNTWFVVVITAVMMIMEIIAGLAYHSMALLADGWHMSTHASALAITAISYRLARRYASDPRFAFGTWKIEILGGFASAIVLGMVALYVAVESTTRFFKPLEIQYGQALAVAAIGLAVNLVCAFLLKETRHEHGHEHGQEHGHGHEHGHEEHGRHKDLNLRAAYLHVIADAATSVLAIGALMGGYFLGLSWLDPAIGLLGSIIIATWSYGLIRDTSRVLLDREMDAPLVEDIRRAIESGGDARISDLHLWRVGRKKYACTLAIVANEPKTAEEYKALLAAHDALAHILVEIHRRSVT